MDGGLGDGKEGRAVLGCSRPQSLCIHKSHAVVYCTYLRTYIMYVDTVDR